MSASVRRVMRSSVTSCKANTLILRSRILRMISAASARPYRQFIVITENWGESVSRVVSQCPSEMVSGPSFEVFEVPDVLLLWLFDSVGEVVSRAVSRWDSLRFPAGSIDVPQ